MKTNEPDAVLQKKRSYLMVFLAYSAITLVVFWRRIPGLMTNYGMPDIDTDGTLWSFWARLFTERHSIAFDINNNLLGFPAGFDYSFIPFFSLVYEAIILAVKWLGGSWMAIVAVTNISALLAYPLSALSGFGLAYYLTRNKYASFIAGLIFSFSTYHILMGRAFMSTNHIEFIPLYFLSLLYALDKKTTAAYMISALTLSVTFMCNAYLAFFSGLFSIPFVLFYHREMLAQKIKTFVLYYATVFIILCLTNLNFIISQHRVLNRQNLEVLRGFVPEGQVVTVLSFFTPSVGSWLYPMTNSGNNFMGYAALALGLAGVFILRKNKLFILLFACFMLSVLLAANVHGLFFINRLYFYFFGMFRAVSRINILSSLFLSLMAAMAIKQLMEKFLCQSKK